MDKSIKELLKAKTTVEQDRLEMWYSLQECIIICGGDIDTINHKISSGLPVYGLIDLLAQNKIRFTYDS